MASATATEVELMHYSQPASSTQNETPTNDERIHEIDGGFSLPPTDRGKHAWLLLFSCFMLEAIIWGALQRFHQYECPLLIRDRFRLLLWHLSGKLQHPSAIRRSTQHRRRGRLRNGGTIRPEQSTITNGRQGIMYMWIIPMFVLLKIYPRLRIWAAPVGLTVMSLSLGLYVNDPLRPERPAYLPSQLTLISHPHTRGSLATNVTHLIITQGIMYAIGGGLAWTPILFYIEEWWVLRRGFAYGTTMAGLGLSGAIMPVVLQWLLDSYGFRTTLRVCALSVVALNIPSCSSSSLGYPCRRRGSLGSSICLFGHVQIFSSCSRATYSRD